MMLCYVARPSTFGPENPLALLASAPFGSPTISGNDGTMPSAFPFLLDFHCFTSGKQFVYIVSPMLVGTNQA